MKREQLVVEARAKIIWGESAASVCEFLVANGFSEAEARAEISRHQKERNSSIRRQGIAGILVGVPLVVIAVMLLEHAIHYDKAAAGIFGNRRVGFETVAGLLAAGYGLWKSVNGIFALMKPSSEDRSLTEL
jgi:hypothetical protein